MSDVIVRFDNVNFGFSEKKIILDEVCFSVREGSKITLMGQNGAGKSTIFQMLMGDLKPNDGAIHIASGQKIAIAKQVFERNQLSLTTRAYFESAFVEVPYNLDKRIKESVEITNLENWSLEKTIGQYSGGQQARLLLAHALIQEPQILLLDEPTNNLDVEGIEYLTGFLMMYMETCIVISHDADFLNSFTDGVLYLDVNTHKVEQYSGDYFKVVDEIANRIEREQKLNSRMERQIEDQKAKINFFANKGGKMRKLASKLRDDVAEAEENKVDVRREDRTIRKFKIPCQDGLSGALVNLTKVDVINKGVLEVKDVDIELRKKSHLQIKGSNGMGKTTLLNKLANGQISGLNPDVKIGYYTQDFSNLDFERTVFDELIVASGLEIGEFLLEAREQKIRGTAAGFLIDGKIINTKIGDLSEGQKGLVAFARLVLLEPGLIILDEPTNHINFRHVPVIADALADFEGAMILVSHISHFTDQIGVEQELDLAKLIKN